MHRLIQVVSFLALIFLQGAARAATTETDSSTVYVAANGVDVFPCGTRENPCRSISFGIANADLGSTVLVGPGRYGDLDGDGTLGGTGEELGEVGYGCLCILKIHVPVRIISTHGAGATVIDASGLVQSTLPVLITSSDAQFGRQDHGFLLKASANYVGVYVFATTGVIVAGNTAMGGSTGFFTDGGSNNVLEHNIAYDNDVGFEVAGSNQIVRLNQASSNVIGFAIYATDSRITGNIASSNDDSGFAIAGSSSNVVLTKNLATGNRTAGFRVDAGGTPAIVSNNIYGNFCGIFNRSDTTIDATHNYWGAPSGPGPDPADDVCNDEIDDITLTEPVSRRPIPLPK